MSLFTSVALYYLKLGCTEDCFDLFTRKNPPHPQSIHIYTISSLSSFENLISSDIV